MFIIINVKNNIAKTNKIKGFKMLENFSDEQFESKVKKEEVSIIQFSATWCGPCKSLKPIMDKISEEYSDKKYFWALADVEDDGINTGSAMGIRGVPSTIIFKKGIEIDRLVGNPGEQAVREFISKSV
ncbi:thioredoxin family protein [Candidatus Pelagibacter sp.]|nr:thioredoxin family protein [Candidatus Pelagibacter sp.]